MSTCLEELIHTLQENAPLELLDENQDYLDLCIDKILMKYPIVFQHRYSQLLKDVVQKKISITRYHSLSLINAAQPHISILSQKYSRLFDAWIEDDNVSFATTNKALAGKLSLKDCFVLHLFAMATCRRIKNDQCYSLAVTGASTTGKSTLFESPLFEFGHSYNIESGVGRFCLGSKNLLIAQDIGIKILISGKDAAKFRCIARGEPIKYKTFGSEATLKPTFLFITSNENIQTHRFKKTNNANLTTTLFPSRLTGAKHKRMYHDEFVTAIKNRFLEAFVQQQPNISLQLLPSDGEYFERIHLVLGLFNRVLNIVSTPLLTFDEYGSKSLFRYCLTGLNDNFDLFQQNMTFDTLLVNKQMDCAKNKLNKNE